MTQKASANIPRFIAEHAAEVGGMTALRDTGKLSNADDDLIGKQQSMANSSTTKRVELSGF